MDTTIAKDWSKRKDSSTDSTHLSAMKTLKMPMTPYVLNSLTIFAITTYYFYRWKSPQLYKFFYMVQIITIHQ